MRRIDAGVVAVLGLAFASLAHAEVKIADGKHDEAMGQFGRIAKLSDLPPKKTLAV